MVRARDSQVPTSRRRLYFFRSDAARTAVISARAGWDAFKIDTLVRPVYWQWYALAIPRFLLQGGACNSSRPAADRFRFSKEYPEAGRPGHYGQIGRASCRE